MHFMQIVSVGDEMSKPVYWGKIRNCCQFVICSIIAECVVKVKPEPVHRKRYYIM